MPNPNITVYHVIVGELNIDNWKLIRELAYKAEDNKKRLTDMFINGDYFTAVANVDNTTLDDAYRLTNSIDVGWWENEEVSPLFKADGAKSTDIGDLMMVEIPLEAKTENDAIAHYELYVVAPIGFVKIDG